VKNLLFQRRWHEVPEDSPCAAVTGNPQSAFPISSFGKGACVTNILVKTKRRHDAASFDKSNLPTPTTPITVKLPATPTAPEMEDLTTTPAVAAASDAAATGKTTAHSSHKTPPGE